MNNPIVSVILPNRNYADFISDAINSIKAQTLSDWECIIIDDGTYCGWSIDYWQCDVSN